MLRADGIFTPAAITLALALAAAAVIVEAILFRGLIGFGRSLFAVTIAFSAALLLLEIPIVSSLLRLGRRLEIRLRLAFLEKIPRLGDRYFQSRLKSDMAERSHSIHLIRRLPELGGQLLRYSFEIIFTTAGIIWIDPASAPIALLAAFAALAIPLASQPLLMERDLRLRTHAGALTHFYLDALLGLVAIHTHGGQPAVRREHESLLTEWARAGLNLQRAVLSLETLQFLVGLRARDLAAGLSLGTRRRSGAVLLLVYWALNLPALGQEVAIIAWQYPSYRNVTLRLLEPLGCVGTASTRRAAASIDQALPSPSLSKTSASSRPDIRFSATSTCPSRLALTSQSSAHREPANRAWWDFCSAGIAPHPAPSWWMAIELDDSYLDRLRPHIAWVDPAVQLWNRPLVRKSALRLAGCGAESSRPSMPLNCTG